MKFTKVSLLTLGAMFAASNANAGMLIDIYGGLSTGLGSEVIFVNDDSDSEFAQSYGVLLGIDIPLFRFEAEYSYLTTEYSDINAAMVNAYFKIPTPVVKPYIGIGAGMLIDSTVASAKMDKDIAAYQGMLGLTFDIPMTPFKVDAEARALYAPDFYDIGFAKPDFLYYELRAKLRYVF